MSDLSNKKILLGVSGGIALYKSAELVRLLIKQGAIVQVVMTKSAREFVSEMTFQALSGRTVRCELFDPAAEAGMGHIELARWADLILIAPASANTIARLSHGFSDNLLSCICLAADVPIVIAPAMNQYMWLNHVTQENIERLIRNPVLSVCGPEMGEQACGDVGPGRMLAPEKIIYLCQQKFLQDKHDFTLLRGKKVLITAGPTVEDIDPVRYLSNRSSGKMGYAIATAAFEQGAEVILVSGPVSLGAPAGIALSAVRSAQEMHDRVLELVHGVDVFIATAAVADYRPEHPKQEKIKKDNEKLVLALVKNPDILATVAKLPNKPYTVGFAAETQNLKQHAQTKLEQKKLDMIAANKVSQSEGFEQDDNALELFWKDGVNPMILSRQLPLASKKHIARQLVTEIAQRLKEKKNCDE